MRALLIEVNFSTGKRAGNINPRDPKLRCYGWQNLDSDPGLEIRLVEDDRDLSSLAGVAGITILEGKQSINDAIIANIPAKYAVKDSYLMVEHMKAKGISLDTLASKNQNQIAEELFAKGVAGITERKPKLVE